MAVNINRVVITGNLTRDPELRQMPSGTAVCSLRVAVNGRRKDASTGEWVDDPNFFDVQAFGAQGENAARYLAKGRPVAIDGRLNWREWQDRDGNKRQNVEIVADNVQFLGGRDEAAAPATHDFDSFDAQPAATPAQPAATPAQAAPAPAPAPARRSFPDDDIPFVWDGPPEYESRYHQNR